MVFEDDGGALVKKMAGYHQFGAVRFAVVETLRAANLGRGVVEHRGAYESGPASGGKPGDKRVGVVWHTQGAGKSLDDGVLRRRHHPAPRNGEPHHRSPN